MENVWKHLENYATNCGTNVEAIWKNMENIWKKWKERQRIRSR